METSSARVTQTDVARVAGVHNTTVSLALRNSPSIPEGTRKRIQALANQMGYHPDPVLRALVAYRKGRTLSDRRETIAYITNAETRGGWRDQPADHRFHVGAEKKAALHGYHLEHFWLGEPGLSQRRLSNILFHRGVTGVLLASHRDTGDEMLDFDWGRVGAVKIGCFPPAPALHRVMDDQQAVVRLAMKRIMAAGYRRIGLILPIGWDRSTDRAWSTAFLIEQNRLPGGSRIPIYFLPSNDRCVVSATGGDEPAGEAEPLATWFDEFRPDVILSSWDLVGALLDDLGITVSRDVGFADLFMNAADGRVAGVRPNSERVGEIATEMLVSQMQQNICGAPAIATTTLVEGVWSDGASLPLRKASTGLTARSLPIEEPCEV